MELWATGFNAWGQLQFDENVPNEALDLTEFTCILRIKGFKILKTSHSATILETTNGAKVAGVPDNTLSALKERRIDLGNIAVAGNEKICSFTKAVIRQYQSLKDHREGNYESFENLGQIKQLEANETSFTALSSNGQVYTWGDERYGDCFGRETTRENPASKPSVIEDLANLEDGIFKISSGGYASAALTSANDVYLWGKSGEPRSLFTGSPTPLDLDGHDILDVSVGFNHMVVLTIEGKVFIVGEGGNGQLGLDVGKTETWKQLLLPLTDRQRIVGVHAGYKNTFLVIESTTY